MKEDPMTTHAPRPAAAAARTGAAPRRGGEDASRRLRRVAGRAVLVAASVGTLLGLSPTPASPQTQFELRPTITFATNHDNPAPDPCDAECFMRLLNSAEIYLMLMKPDGTPDGPAPRRLTNNATGEFFPVLSPDGKKIVFDSNRLKTATEPVHTSDLFVMDTDGGKVSALTRGSSASWSPDGTRLAFHASASGTGTLGAGLPGVPTADSDLFVLNVDDCLAVIRGTNQDPTRGNCRTAAPGPVRNLTNTPGEIEDDADWSPDGTRIVFTSRPFSNQIPPPPAHIYVTNADGTRRQCLTCQFSNYGYEQELAPDWSPDGTRIAFMCKPPDVKPPDRPLERRFAEICVMPVNADVSTGPPTQLTHDNVPDLGPVWSPDGTMIVFARSVEGQHPRGLHQLFVIAPRVGSEPRQLTELELGVHNTQPSWGMLRVKAP
jgi:dipeptidyl aminopeptidase/acylaminoacyl peptidase